MIGNLYDARRAAEGRLGLLSDYGSARTVYRSGDVVYKVDKDEGANLSEWRRYKSITSVPAKVMVPRMSLYTVGDDYVIAAEFIDGEQSGECSAYISSFCEEPGLCLPGDIMDDISMTFQMIDFAWGNVIRKNGIYYVVDLEC